MQTLLNIIVNRYLWATIAFVAWMLFFDKNNFFLRMERTAELKDLNSRISYYEKEIGEAKSQLSKLQNDPATLEQYAREQYYMRRPNEQIFVFDSIRPKAFLPHQQ